MTPVTDEEFEELLHRGFEREALHLEMRDAYGTAVELPHMAKWAAGEPDDLEWLQGWAPRSASTSRRAGLSSGRGLCPSR